MNTQTASLPAFRALEFSIRRVRIFLRRGRRGLVRFWRERTWRMGSVLGGVLNVSMVRRVAPDRPPLERHEFESVETRRGGFGSW